jgi:hypothetical protein
MAPLGQYLIPDEKAEIALARSAAPASISDAAEVMVLRRDGFATAASGSNGFVCVIERSWGKATDDSEFWRRCALRIASIRRPRRYEDTFVKMDGAWLFAERKLYVDWLEQRELS